MTLVVWGVWLVVALATIAVSGALRLVSLHPHMRTLYREGHGPLWLLEGWDYRWYAIVANRGYEGGGLPSYAFFPLWPTLIRAFGHIGPQGVLAVGAATVCSLAAFVGVALTHPAGRIRGSALALAAMPGSFALLLPYADGLALALASLSLVAAKRDRWTAAGLLAFLAATARPNGFLLALLLAGAARGRVGRARWAAVAAPIAGFVLVNGVFWALSGRTFAFLDAEKHWHRGSPGALFRSIPAPWTSVQPWALAAALVLLMLLWRSRHRYGNAPLLFAASVVALSLASGTLDAFSRQMLFAFPLVWAAADLPRHAAPAAAAAGIAANVASILLLPHVFP